MMKQWRFLLRPLVPLRARSLFCRRHQSLCLFQRRVYCAGVDKSRGPMPVYNELVANGSITADDSQLEALEKMQTIYDILIQKKRQKPRAQSSPFEWIKTWAAKNMQSGEESQTATQGLYMYGDVGCGKTFLMDILHDTAPEPKKRVHFNEFMDDFHNRRGKSYSTPIEDIAGDISKEAGLLCFDEFQVTNQFDAHVLLRLFKAMFANGTVIVMTSNLQPEGLYAKGLRRVDFLPFIDLVNQRCIVHKMSSSRDFRLRGTRKNIQTYYRSITPETQAAMTKAFLELSHNVPAEPMTLKVKASTIVKVPKAARGVAWFHFDDLCKKAYGIAEFMVLAKTFHTIFLSEIPRMNYTMSNEALRFIKFVDEVYNHKTKLVCSAEEYPADLFDSGDENQGGESRLIFDAQGNVIGNLWSGEEERNSFARAVSRLMEMQTEEYLTIPHNYALSVDDISTVAKNQ